MKVSITWFTVALVIALSAVLGGVTGSAFAADARHTAGSSDDPVTWAVRPSDGEAADGRTAIEWELDPGESARDYFEVTNLSKFTVEFAVAAADGYQTPQGRFNMLPSDRPSTDAGNWIDLDAGHVVIKPGESATVSFTITVPDNATPGDHPAGIAASVLSVATAGDGTAMGVESRVGFRVMTRVTGELSPAVALSDVAVSYVPSWHLFSAGAVEVTYVAANAGNTRLEVSSTESVISPISTTSADPSEPTELFPADERSITARIGDVWPLGFATVVIELSAVPVPGGQSTAAVTALQEVVVWTIPWLEILILAGFGLLVFAFFWGRRRQAAKIDRLIAEARRSFQRPEDRSAESER